MGMHYSDEAVERRIERRRVWHLNALQKFAARRHAYGQAGITRVHPASTRWRIDAHTMSRHTVFFNKCFDKRPPYMRLRIFTVSMVDKLHS